MPNYFQKKSAKCFSLFLIQPTVHNWWRQQRKEMWLLLVLTCNRWHTIPDMWNVKRDTWYVICDTWQVTTDTWHMTCKKTSKIIENLAYGQHSAFLYMCDVHPKTVNTVKTVKDSSQQLKKIKNGQKQSKRSKTVQTDLKIGKKP